MGTLSGALRIILNATAEKGCGIPADLPAISGVRTLNNLRTRSRVNHQHHRDLVNIQPACSALVIHPHLLRACTVKHFQTYLQVCVYCSIYFSHFSISCQFPWLRRGCILYRYTHTIQYMYIWYVFMYRQYNIMQNFFLHNI